MTCVVSNTGPLLHLSEIDALEFLKSAGPVHIPSEVDDELARLVHNWQHVRPPWLSVSNPGDAIVAQIRPWLDAGVVHLAEAQALALACQLRAHWFLTDDAAARLLAIQLGLEVHGSLGIILWAAASGQVDQPRANDLLDRLAASSLWLSHRIVTEARDALALMFR